VQITDVIGLIGTILVLATYLALQFGLMRQEEPPYSLLNGLGALLIMVSLLSSFNLAAFVMQIAWLLISIVGLVRALRRKTKVNQTRQTNKLSNG
jgi:predicted membrane protein